MNLLITGAWQDAKVFIPQIEALGHSVVFLQHEKDKVPCPYKWVEGVICNGLFQAHPIERFPNLRYVQLTSAGFDRIPMEYARKHGIEVHNARGVYSVPMAEWTLMYILELYKNAARSHERQEAHLWEKDRTWRELAGKKACIIGCGVYGQETAKRLKAFDVSVCVVNRTKRNIPYIDFYYPPEKLNDALEDADIVVMAVALTPETYHMIGAPQLAAMKAGAIFLNAARGDLVDEDALVEALHSGRLTGVALDVFETEPLKSDSPLWEMQNVIVTPHNSFVGDGNGSRLWECIRQGLMR